MSNNVYLQESLLGPDEVKKDEKTENEGTELTNQGIVTITAWLFAVRASTHACARAYASVCHTTDPLPEANPAAHTHPSTALVDLCDRRDHRCGSK
jgi:hypothetical protein